MRAALRAVDGCGVPRRASWTGAPSTRRCWRFTGTGIGTEVTPDEGGHRMSL
ncbi:hypothetical protein QJS66_06290 [Kocuria rhizophila]|nr:hypothetical protein QJS66_06290 [Kocuria rhizophila]